MTAIMLWILCGVIGTFILLKADEDVPAKTKWLKGKNNGAFIVAAFGGITTLLISIVALHEIFRK